MNALQNAILPPSSQSDNEHKWVSGELWYAFVRVVYIINKSVSEIKVCWMHEHVVVNA